MSDRISTTRQACDRCGPVVPAAVLYLTEELELALCAHHSRQHSAALKARGFDAYELDVSCLWDVGSSPVPG